ncbi:hypothetical protein Goshw_019920 [Gossypium schwendimanii]|uniref:Uncharacterized protein n=1 Tax=Gossypium schwendimanii TaxID=34291 RepID=A0A7J9KYC3_GOSSC|nr:hypothetical protein [Gossypium schwendimanii]
MAVRFPTPTNFCSSYAFHSNSSLSFSFSLLHFRIS